MTLSANERMFQLNTGWFVTIYNVIFVADMRANGCATLVPYQKVNMDSAGCSVSTVWDVKLKAFMMRSFCFFVQPALLNATSFYDCV